MGRRYLSHHMFSVDEGLKAAHGGRIVQREDILGLDRHRAQVGVFLEDDDLSEDTGDEAQS